MNYFLLFFFLLVYFLLPTNNSVNDAYSYAADIKYEKNLFHPHHLLYSATGYAVSYLIPFKADILSLMKILNALFSVMSLWVLYKILKFLKKSHVEIFSFLLFTGSSFAVMRYATENETYIIPIFFSLIGSFYFIRFLANQRILDLCVSGLFTSIACLYHQIHFFWWLGILVSVLLLYKKGRIKAGIVFLIPALLVPITYLLVIKLYLNEELLFSNVLHFIFYEFYKGGVNTDIGLNNFILTGISFIRSFFQVHGNLLYLIKFNLLFLLPILLFLSAVFYLLLKKKIRFTWTLEHSSVAYSHLIVFVLQSAFAFYSVGNAEFMVMMPFLISIIWAGNKWIPSFAITVFSSAMLLWNMAYGILPNHFLKYSINEDLKELAIKKSEALFILKNKNEIKNLALYTNGIELSNIVDCPSVYSIKKISMDSLEIKINKTIEEENPVFTDCIGNTEAFNRQAFLKGNMDEEFFQKFHTSQADSFSVFYGKKYLHQVIYK